MASVTYGKCYLWQRYYGKCNYGKDIMANETEPLWNLIPCEQLCVFKMIYNLSKNSFTKWTKIKTKSLLFINLLQR